jgi:hypothetical protein
VLKLTNAAGEPIYVRLTAITLVRDVIPGEYTGEAKAAVMIGAQVVAVRETVQQIISRLGGVIV